MLFFGIFGCAHRAGEAHQHMITIIIFVFPDRTSWVEWLIFVTCILVWASTRIPTLRFGRAIAQAVSRWLPTAAARVRARGLVMWDLWWTKWRWGRFSLSTSASPTNLHSTKFSITITRGRCGQHAEWTQFGLHPPLCKFKKKFKLFFFVVALSSCRQILRWYFHQDCFHIIWNSLLANGNKRRLRRVQRCRHQFC
jgi:hypothetical protein